MFKEVYSNSKTPITFETITKAIEAFERTLIQPARFDEFLDGNIKSLTYNEKRGMFLFRQNCITCHSGNLIGGETYRWFGLTGNYWDFTGSTRIDKGLFNITGDKTYLYRLKYHRCEM